MMKKPAGVAARGVMCETLGHLRLTVASDKAYIRRFDLRDKRWILAVNIQAVIQKVSNIYLK